MDAQKDYNLPDSKGHFAEFGGRFVPETLIQHWIVLKNNI